ncbi:serine palmitoyltransferase [Solimonas terrae]|uniref:Pyridoxal phosphate-dependent aminotransferase family protein n=1 Tax=Solimonas terrae TaxID=1396819 RepID=A0A6M2BNN3_9GAMM|nr:pyridoxal phosphate-dependent aminotransferase family protein [Solimonas terrae]NGY03633.1 pyridoxal phosphate-dependent aminotransferase family protein [Solimonas terrae]
MSIFDKFDHLRQTYDSLGDRAHNPFSVSFDRIESATEGVLGGRRVILLGTNNYLGLTFDQHGIDEAVRAVQTLGTGTTGSRVANGSYAGHGALERDLAAFFGRRHCMVFSTGYQANLGMLSTIVGRGDHLILDSDSHASIYDGARLGHAEVIRFRHSDPDDLYKRLRRLKDVPGSKLIVAEGIYSMLGDVAPLREIAAVKREMGAYLMVDEAHSMGVLGEHGRGLAEAAGVEADVDFIVGTFSKSLGSVGGFCVADLDGFDILRVACRPYMFTASLPPSIIASTRSALQRLDRDKGLRTQLMANATQLHGGLRALGLEVGPHISPVVSVALDEPEVAVRFWNALVEGGVYLNLALPPATPSSRPLLRASVSAAHSPRQIQKAVDLFGEIGRELGILPAEPFVELPRIAVGAV